ncbi:putative methyl-accepting chemotaxis protein [Desulforapulum autotrophicum HRM2]|uniref:Methyl-accepting chemotaxis protein n=1 Tax=Desulforapulum autotrophicum (strain ATCC 43914 / DSM 3382 / VKM B-1955 / HRM2) TaxID=177437 RepID=C0Q9D2_DESAH|nr:methyl-accepting chemotaxis protein [Desulforapulum autotrophicum]ACN16637.1 putative methyl-accepting chemotaxis protein [Desulforapulum autotrophicum HRM2]
MIHSVNSSPLTPSKGVESSNHGKQATGSGFQEVLETVTRETSDPTGTQTTQSASALQEITAPGFDLESDTPAIQGMTDELLDMLDQYTDRLGNGETSLKDLDPMLNAIRDHAATLLEKTTNATDTDAELKEIAVQSALVANNAYVKFQRGDYL